MMHRCIISLAANCNQKENLAEARHRLSQILFDIIYTTELWTEPIHSVHSQEQFKTIAGKHTDCKYLNQLAYAYTTLNTKELESALKAIESTMGRSESDRQQGIVRIDLDLMLFDETRHHTQDWERIYIKELLRQKVEHQQDFGITDTVTI